MTANHQKLMALDAAPGGEDAHGADLWEGAQGYLIGLILSVLLTALAFFFSGSDWLWEPSIPVALSVLAVAQIGVHLAFFLHLTMAVRSVPSHAGSHGAPVPAQAVRRPCGAPTTTTQVPSLPVTSQASHWPLQAASQQKPSTQLAPVHISFRVQRSPSGRRGTQAPPGLQ
jgi:heme/copper-type cytochrome/quinol oxidase subunit 4